MVALGRLLMDDPDDVEAESLYWLLAGRVAGVKGAIRYGLEAVLDGVLDLDLDHVGALHYRVHGWDGKEGHYAIESCMKLGELGHGSGHLLHVPGHVLSRIGLWHEAAIATDRAARVETTCMNQRMIMPEDDWDDFHILDDLCYIQEQLGMAGAALLGALLLAAECDGRTLETVFEAEIERLNADQDVEVAAAIPAAADAAAADAAAASVPSGGAEAEASGGR